MLTTLDTETAVKQSNPSIGDAPLFLRTRREAREYLAKHLKPVGFGPKGQPLYAQKDIDALNIMFPEDVE